MSHPGERERGYTLLELIVALAVLGLLVSITALNFGVAGRAPSFRAQSADIVRAMKLAQSEALATNAERAFAVDVEAKTWSAGCCANGTIDESFAVALRFAAGEQMSSRYGQIRFYPDGSTSGGMLTLERDGRRREIAADWVAGRITVADTSP